jgi:hypothetical protein
MLELTLGSVPEEIVEAANIHRVEHEISEHRDSEEPT